MIDVVAGIIWRGEKFLAVRRPEGKAHAGSWEFPGGKVESGESLGAALGRELEEELGLRVTDAEFWRQCEHVYPNISVRLHFFHVRGFDGEPRPLEGHGLSWVTPREACDLAFLEADTAIVRALCG